MKTPPFDRPWTWSERENMRLERCRDLGIDPDDQTYMTNWRMNGWRMRRRWFFQRLHNAIRDQIMTKTDLAKIGSGNMLSKLVADGTTWIAEREAFPKGSSPSAFARDIMQHIDNMKPKTKMALWGCSEVSFMRSVAGLARLDYCNLNPALGQVHAYLVPYGETCQTLLSYKGMIHAAKVFAGLQHVISEVAFEGEEFDFDPLRVDRPIVHRRNDVIRRSPDRQISHVYAQFHVAGNPYPIAEAMSWFEIAQHRDRYSKAAGHDDSPWQTAVEPMAKKTVIRRAFNGAKVALIQFAEADSMQGVVEGEVISVNADPQPLPPADAVLDQTPARSGSSDFDADGLPVARPDSNITHDDAEPPY